LEGAKLIQEHPDIAYVVLAAAALDAAHLSGASHGIERCVYRIQAVVMAKISHRKVRWSQMLHVLGRGELFEILDDIGIPIRHVPRQLLDYRGRAFAPPVSNGVGDL